MNDKEIISQLERNYIDTLYLSCNLQDHYSFSMIDDITLDDHLKYYCQRRSLETLYLLGSKKIADANGYEWYQLPNYRLGLMNYEKAIRANQPNCIIQYEHSHIFPLDHQLTGLDLPFSQDRSNYMIKRIDLTKTARLDIDYTVNHGYISPFKGDPLNPTRHENTVYLGSRLNGNVFRMYPKTRELMETKNYDKIALYSNYFDTIEDLYTFEHELRRSYLKETLGIDTLDELEKVWLASRNIVSKIRIFEITDHNRKLIKSNNRKRIKAMILTPFIEYERPEKKKYKRSYPAMIKRMRTEYERYLQSEEGKSEEGNALVIQMIYDLFQDTLDGKDIEVWFTDSTRKQEMDEMRAKHQAMRDNQGNELEIEAKRHFGKFLSRRNAVSEIEV